VKFTDHGGRVTLVLALDDAGAFRLCVSDTGIGMDPADIPRALTPFVQVHGARDDSQRGTGLGLPLVKSLVELHGGRLEIQSAEGDGTTVTAILPKERVVGARRRRGAGLRRKPQPVQAAE
jgi:signal transduction histidine kinase